MLANFYDIESLTNVFTLANFKRDKNILDIYLLLDDISINEVGVNMKRLESLIYEKNKNFNGTIYLYNLREPSTLKRLASEFGMTTVQYINNPALKDAFTQAYPNFRLVCDTDKDFDEDKHPYLMGYNSYNYDTTMLAYFLSKTIGCQLEETNDKGQNGKTVIHFNQISAKEMREFNDELFEDRFIDAMPSILYHKKDVKYNRYTNETDFNNAAYLIRKNMMMSGRHIDVAKLNEKQQKVALKRLLGQLGFQILESDKLSGNDTYIHGIDELFELIAYNVSDVVNLAELFDNNAYTSAFTLKKQLLQTYPELIYRQKANGEYEPDISPDCVRKDRLTIDSSSARFATMTLCPYGHLKDIEVVSFDYPHQDMADKLGIPRVNILDETKKFFYQCFPQTHLREKFDQIYAFYKNIEGKNFNESKNYQKDFGTRTRIGETVLKYPAQNLSKLVKNSKTETCIPYFDKDGNPTSCFAAFSTGGIHGAEYNKALFESDFAQYETITKDMAYVQSVYPDPLELKKARTVTMPDGTERPAMDFLKSGSTLKKSNWKNLHRKKPVLFTENDKGGTKLHPKYVFTSADECNHEDFTSYYPNLLRMMKAFYNDGLGYDRYGEIFEQKSKYGKLMKDETLSEDERKRYKILREGVKLILNSASGAGDATFESNIRMNNQIISMRIIGQLFSYRIAMAQTFKGAKIPSTNTDGLYSVMEETLNNKILAEEAKDIGVEIEPEPMFLISKDTNNRIEYDMRKHKVISVSGGTLACASGPSPTKSLAHPAIIDYVLREYLLKCAMHYKNTSLNKPFNRDVGREIINTTFNIWEPKKWLNMFQNLVASSKGSKTYIYKIDPNDPSKYETMQHYNRVFIMKDETPKTVHLYAATYRVITDATKNKRKRDGETDVQHDRTAKRILEANGERKVPPDTEAATKKVTNIESDWYMFIQNKSLRDLSEDEYNFIIDNIDIEKYLTLVEDCFIKNWYNKTPHPADKYEMMVTVKPKKGDETIVEITDTNKKREIYDIINNSPAE